MGPPVIEAVLDFLSVLCAEFASIRVEKRLLIGLVRHAIRAEGRHLDLAIPAIRS